MNQRQKNKAAVKSVTSSKIVMLGDLHGPMDKTAKKILNALDRQVKNSQRVIHWVGDVSSK